MSTLLDVARLAGVSTATVLHVVNASRPVSPRTRARVERALTQLNFVPGTASRSPTRPRPPARLPLARVPEAPGARGTRARHLRSPERLAPEPRPRASPVQPQAVVQSLSLPPGDTARTILRLVRAAQPISRADLARRLDVNRSTVTEIVKPLLAAGVLCEAGPEPSSVARVGRPPIGLSLRDQESFFIGVNLGVRRSQVGAASVGGQLLAEETFETPAEARPALNRIRVSVERMRATMHGRRLLAIGVSVPGPTDAQRSRLLYAPHLGWQDVAISAALAMKERRGSKGSGVEVPVIVENDATAAASYEARRRLGSGGQGAWRDFVLVRAGTGIGAGLVVGGEVYQGSGADGGLLGEFGHMTIVAGGKVCVCGNRGCWERYASAASAVALYAGERRQMRGEPPPRFAEIVARAEAGELRARATLEKTGEYLGIGIGNIMSGMGVTRVVVSGRIVLGWKYLKKKVEEAVGATMAGRLSNWKIEAGEAEGASVGGAVELVIEQHLAMLARLSKSAA